MKVNEYLAKAIKYERGVVFGITGGAIINVFDALHKEGVKLVPMHHEQACAMAADAFARVSGRLGCCVTTSGPGTTNTITGTAGSYYDSIPVLNISGQVASKHLKAKHNKNLRQFGFQETDIKTLFKSITKHSELIDSSFNFREKLRTTISKAKNDRPGPVILDICDDVQRQEIKESKTVNFSPKGVDFNFVDYTKTANLIKNAKRPLVILGHGVRIGKYEKRILEFIEKLKIPVLLTWGALDLLDNDHPLNIRDFGVTSQRIGNFAVQNADLLIVLGSKLDTHELPYHEIYSQIKTIVVDIDANELDKLPDDVIKVNEDIGDFIKYMDFLFGFYKSFKNKYKKWLSNIQKLRVQYPINNKAPNENCVDPYKFIDACSYYANADHIIIPDAGQNLTWSFQGWKIKRGQRLFSAFNHSPMGYALPASIGAYYGSNRPIICIVGDGGLQMNIQELQTIAYNKLPIKIFVLNNNGYGMIKQTQSDWSTLNKNVMCDETSGLTFPNLQKIANAYDIQYKKLKNDYSLSAIKNILNFDGPMIIEVMIQDGDKIEPKLKFGDAFVNQKPYLFQKEIEYINKNIVKGCL
jgi:acetolactate synthase I/II/III large subunit